MKHRILLLLIIITIAISFPAHAGDFEFALGDKTLQLYYLTSSSLLGSKKQDLNFGILLTEKRDIVGSAGLMVPDLLSTTLPQWISFAVGGRGYVTLLSEPKDTEVFSLSPGVEIRLSTSKKKLPIHHLTGSFFYAPEILTFGEADHMFDFTVRYEVGFTSSTVGFIGYRMLRYEFKGVGDKREVDEGVHAGFRITF